MQPMNVLPELRRPIGSVVEYDIDDAVMSAYEVTLHDVEGTLTLLRTDRGLLVSFSATARMEETCARCLEETLCMVDLDFEEEYVPVLDPNTGAKVRVKEPADIFRIGPDFVLDLREGLRQYILMSEPLKPLCRPDCRGLCPRCGADLNRGACDCDIPGDERWRALAGLGSKLKEGS
jgi:uncharacterized protein